MMRRWCAALAPSRAPRRWPRREAPAATRLRAKLANLHVGLFLNLSDVILKMPLDLSHAHTFPATEGDNVGGGLKVLLDQDHRFDEIFAAGHLCLLFDFDHLIPSGVTPFMLRQITVEALATLLRKGYETSKSTTRKF